MWTNGLRLSKSPRANPVGPVPKKKKRSIRWRVPWTRGHLAGLLHNPKDPWTQSHERSLTSSFERAWFKGFNITITWAKFGESLNKPTTVAIETLAVVFVAVSIPLWHILTVRVCTEDRMEIVYSNISKNQSGNGKTNFFVVAFATFRARLYESLEKLKEGALYFDMDSVIYRGFAVNPTFHSAISCATWPTS